MEADDTRLLRGCLEGRREAWDELVDRYSPYIYFLVHATLRKHVSRSDDDAVEEIHNTVFLALLEDDMRRLRAFRGENGCSLRSWLRIITIHRTIDHLKALRPMMSLDAQDEEGRALVDTLASSDEDAETLLVRLQQPEAAEVIAAAIEDLSGADRALYELFFVEALTSEEAAARLGVSKGAVYTRKCRMLDRMGAAVKRRGYLDDGQGRGPA